jgi:hypothetical protein
VLCLPPPAGQLGPRVHQAMAKNTGTPLLATASILYEIQGVGRKGLTWPDTTPDRHAKFAETIKPQTNKTNERDRGSENRTTEHKQNKSS